MARFDGLALAFAFPGVGVRGCGRERAFARRHRRTVDPYLAAASDRVGRDLAGYLGGAPGQLPERAEQLLGFAFGCAVDRVLRQALGREPAAVAGYSMGLYAALHGAGVLSFEDGLELTAGAFAALARICTPGAGHGMAVVLGLDEAEVQELLGEAPCRGAALVNRNNPTSLVLAGPTAPLEVAMVRALRRGALRAELLSVGLPYHHPELLARARAGLEHLTGQLTWRQASCPLVSCLDGRALREPEDLRAMTAANICTPVSLPAALGGLAAVGAEAVVECGAGVSLSQNARMVEGSPPFANLKNLERRLGLE